MDTFVVSHQTQKQKEFIAGARTPGSTCSSAYICFWNRVAAKMEQNAKAEFWSNHSAVMLLWFLAFQAQEGMRQRIWTWRWLCSSSVQPAGFHRPARQKQHSDAPPAFNMARAEAAFPRLASQRRGLHCESSLSEYCKCSVPCHQNVSKRKLCRGSVLLWGKI